MPRRCELQNHQWKRIQHLFPDVYHHGQAGHPWKPHRQLLNGMLWRLHSGAPWRDVPSRYGPRQTVYDRCRRWRLDGTWMRILTCLLDHLDKHRRLGRDLWCVAASVIRATRAAGGAEKNPDLAPCLLGPKTRQFVEPPEHALVLCHSLLFGYWANEPEALATDFPQAKPSQAVAYASGWYPNFLL